jgi:hypothetical protein
MLDILNEKNRMSSVLYKKFFIGQEEMHGVVFVEDKSMLGNMKRNL